MRKEKNLTENKGLINTFKKSKLKNYLNKSILGKRDFFFLKYRQNKFCKFFKKLSKFVLYKNVFNNLYCSYNKKSNLFKKSQFKKTSNFFKLTLMFIDLYFY
jgi:hypothetical protein